MSKSTPINRLPIENVAEEINENDDALNDVLQEIENQNNSSQYSVPLNNGNKSQPIYNPNIIPQQSTQAVPQYNPTYQPLPSQQAPMPNIEQNNYSQKAVEDFLAKNGLASPKSYSLDSFWQIFKSEFRLSIAIFIVLMILQTNRFDVFATNNLNFINIPYFSIIMKTVLATIMVVILKKILT